MSGPKSSKYILTPEQRRILEEQRKLEKRKKVASGILQKSRSRMLHMGGMFSLERKAARELEERCGDDGGFAVTLEELEAILASVTAVLAATDKDSVDALETAAKSVSESIAKAEVCVNSLWNIAQKNEEKLRENLKEAIAQGLDTSFADVMPGDRVALDREKDRMAANLRSMQRNVRLPGEMQEELAAALNQLESIQEASFQKNYRAITVTPLLKKCQAFLEEYEGCHQEFEELYGEYVALCQMQYYVAQEYPCNRASIQTLKEEIQRISREAAEDDEEAYITACLDQVMEEMGYSVIGHRQVTKKNGKKFRNELYAYAEGTAVNITYSDDGRIAMELGGLDTQDRLPDRRETVALCQSMESFCKDFSQIEKRLLAKGVVLKERISMLPPNEEYAQIINTSDYEMQEDAGTLQVKKDRRTSGKQHTMQRE